MRGRLLSFVAYAMKVCLNLNRRKNERKRSFSIKNVLCTFTLKRVILLFIIFGIIFRIFVTFNYNPGYDASYYITLGRSYSESGKPYLPFGDIETSSLNPTYSTSTRQIFPIYLGLFYSVLGFNYITTKVAALFLSILTLAVVFYITKNLYGKKNAFVITGIVSIINVLIYTTGVIYTENLTYLLLTFGLWGLIKGDKYLPIGVISLSAFYISRCYSLALYISLVLSFFSWLYFMKRKDFWNRYNLIACVSTIPFAIVLYLSNKYSNYPINKIGLSDALINDPLYFLSSYFYFLLFALLYIFIFAIYFIKPLKQSLSFKSPLWMAVIAMTFGIPFAMAYQDYVYNIYTNTPREGLRTIFYVTLPLLWLTIPKIKFSLNEKLHLKELIGNIKNFKEILTDRESLTLTTGAIVATILFMPYKWLFFPIGIGIVSLVFKQVKWKIVILCLMLFIVNLNDNTGIAYSYNRQLGEDMNIIIENGDVIMLDGIDYVKAHNNSQIDRYILAPYVIKSYKIINFDSNEIPDYIITQNPDAAFKNYSILKTYYSNDKRGIFTQTYNILYNFFADPNEMNRVPVYIVWERDEKLLSTSSLR